MFVHVSEIVAVLVVYFIFSSAADAMLPPLPGKERGFYGWSYRFIQNLAANASRAVAAKYPQYPQFIHSAEPVATVTDATIHQRTIAGSPGQG